MARNIIARRNLELRDAIEKAVLKIHAGYRGFFIQTEFGLIAIEVRRSPDGAMRWEDAPVTRFVMDNRKVSCDFYISIGYNEYRQSQDATTFFMTGFMCECLLMKLFRTARCEKSFSHTVILDAVSYIAVSKSDFCGYMSIYENGYKLAKLLGEVKFPAPFLRRGPVYETYLNQGNELYGKRVMAAKNYISEAAKVYTAEGFKLGDFGYDGFYEFLMGMLMNELPNWVTENVSPEALEELKNNAEWDMSPYEAISRLLKKAAKKGRKKEV